MWTASLEKELVDYMKTLTFESKEDEKILYEFYKRLIIVRGWKSIYFVPVNFQGAGDFSPAFLSVECLLDTFKDVALIPLLPKLSKKIANTKSFPHDKIGWNFLSALFEKWLSNLPYIRKGKEFERVGPLITADLPLINAFFPGIVSLQKNNSLPLMADALPGMDWTREFSIGQEGYKAIIHQLSFESDGFLKRLAEVFFADTSIVRTAKSKIWMDVCYEQGNYQNYIALKHEYHLQTKKVADNSVGTKVRLLWNGAESATGLDAALHGFAFHALLGGEIIEVNDTEVKIALDTLAVYYKDSFDFTDDQPLGSWKLPHKHGRAFLSNSSFRQYREIMNMGQDFYIFSKNKIVSSAERGWTVLQYSLKKGSDKAEVLHQRFQPSLQKEKIIRFPKQ